MNICNMWELAIKREIVFSREYVNCMKEEVLFAMVFGYRDALVERLLGFSSSREELMWLEMLISMPYGIKIEANGNLRVFNF